MFGKRIEGLLKKRKLKRELAALLKEIMAMSPEIAAKAILRIFLEAKYFPLRGNFFKKLRKVFFRLSFNDIYAALGYNKMKDHFKGDFWKMVLKFGVDNSDLLCIIVNSDYFFAKEAFNELLKRYGKRRISKDRMRRFLVEIMTRRLEFVSDSWQVLKKLSFSYEDILFIKNSEKYQSDIYGPIREEIQQIFEKLRKDHEQMTGKITELFTVLKQLEELG